MRQKPNKKICESKKHEYIFLMEKIFSLLIAFLMASSVLAQESSSGGPGMVVSGTFARGLTAADNGKTITLHVGDHVFVNLPNEHYFVSGNQQHGLESVVEASIVTPWDSSVLAAEEPGDPRNFVAIARGQATLSYKRTTSYVGYGGVPIPMCIVVEPVSFNIVVIE